MPAADRFSLEKGTNASGRAWGARDANPADLLLVRAPVVGRSFAWLVEATCLGSQNGDADTLSGQDRSTKG
jgi:hypothetical protein